MRPFLVYTFERALYIFSWKHATCHISFARANLLKPARITIKANKALISALQAHFPFTQSKCTVNLQRKILNNLHKNGVSECFNLSDWRKLACLRGKKEKKALVTKRKQKKKLQVSERNVFATFLSCSRIACVKMVKFSLFLHESSKYKNYQRRLKCKLISKSTIKQAVGLHICWKTAENCFQCSMTLTHWLIESESLWFAAKTSNWSTRHQIQVLPATLGHWNRHVIELAVSHVYTNIALQMCAFRYQQTRNQSDSIYKIAEP